MYLISIGFFLDYNFFWLDIQYKYKRITAVTYYTEVCFCAVVIYLFKYYLKKKNG